MNSKHRPLYENGTLGHLKTPSTGYLIGHVKVWAMDNGAFTGKYPGDDAYIERLQRHLPDLDRCLFAAAPDVLYNARATLERLPSMSPRIRSLGYPVALVGQDGMHDLEVPWHLVDWLFVGGSNEWKQGPGGEELIRQAHNNGKPIHIGRVNSRKRFRWAHQQGASSCDGNYLGFGPEVNLPKLLSWFQELDSHP